LKALKEEEGNFNRIHICVYGSPFGVVPLELDEIYPLSQFEVSYPTDIETRTHVIKQVTDYILLHHHRYQAVVLHSAENDNLGKLLVKECTNVCTVRNLLFLPVISKGKTWGKDSIQALVSLTSIAMKNVNSEK
jgi:hypothetical protein